MGATVLRMRAVDELPDLVFTANAALIYQDQAFVSSFKHVQRQRERPVFAEWFHQHGFEVHRLEEGMYHEGAGDALFCGELYMPVIASAATRWRTSSWRK